MVIRNPRRKKEKHKYHGGMQLNSQHIKYELIDPLKKVWIDTMVHCQKKKLWPNAKDIIFKAIYLASRVHKKKK